MVSNPLRMRYYVIFLHLKFVIFFRKPCTLKDYVIYESRSLSVIVTLGGQLYKLLEVVPTATISLISVKKCKNVNS